MKLKDLKGWKDKEDTTKDHDSVIELHCQGYNEAGNIELVFDVEILGEILQNFLVAKIRTVEDCIQAIVNEFPVKMKE